jgi:hypothetical protein
MTIAKGVIKCPCGTEVYSKRKAVVNVTGLKVQADGFYFLEEKLPEKLACPKCGKLVIDGRSMKGNTSVETES